MAAAEKIKAVLRVKEMYFADPITSEEGISTATFTKLPCTYKDDEVPISQEEPEKFEVYCNEKDTPIHTEYVGKPYKLKGSFVDIEGEALTKVVGFTSETKGLSLSGNLKTLEKAIKIVTHSGESLILPRVQGYVRVDFALGTQKISKAPFEFTLLQASDSWNTVLFIPKANT